MILKACNPPFANKVIKIEQEIGLLLPCNVIVQELKEGKTKAIIIDPEKMFKIIENPQLELIAKEVKINFQQFINSLQEFLIVASKLNSQLLYILD